VKAVGGLAEDREHDRAYTQNVLPAEIKAEADRYAVDTQAMTEAQKARLAADARYAARAGVQGQIGRGMASQLGYENTREDALAALRPSSISTVSANSWRL
jgi:hypothetical protein